MLLDVRQLNGKASEQTKDTQVIEIEFTSQLVKQVGCPTVVSASGNSVQEAFDTLDDQYPNLKAHVFSDDGTVHPHLALFLNGEMLDGKEALQTKLDDRCELFVMQAVSGG